MNLSLSKGGRPASVKNRAWHYCQMAWRGVCNQKALSRLAAFSPLLLLGMGQMAHATDLLAGGKDDVKATFGADSFVIMCIYIAEIVIGVATYKTGHPPRSSGGSGCPAKIKEHAHRADAFALLSCPTPETGKSKFSPLPAFRYYL